jgi:hypothetical protein
MLNCLGQEQLWDSNADRLDRSALPLFTAAQQTLRHGLIDTVNGVLAALARSDRWRELTLQVFRSAVITAGFEAIISRALADMSICRNSTAIPLLSGRVNVSFFCSGAITWGRNRADHLTSGWPWPHYQSASQSVQVRALARPSGEHHA